MKLGEALEKLLQGLMILWRDNKRGASTLSGSRVKPDVNLITPPHPD